jgi:hypothetical protein
VPKPSRTISPAAIAAIVLAVCVAALVASWPKPPSPTAGPSNADAGTRTHPARAPEAPHELGDAAPRRRLAPVPDLRSVIPEAADPFASEIFSQPAATVLHDARARYSAGRRFPAPMRVELFRYGEGNPTDARPQLLLAYDEMRLRWWHAAVGHYEKALDADPRSKTPRVLQDLILLVSRGERDRATIAIRKHFGRSAVAEVDRALEDARSGGDQVRIGRLDELRRSL